MKLFVDDVRDAPDDTWTVVRTVTEAIRAIARFEFEVISLDHDISHYNVDAVFDEDGVRTAYNGKITRVRCDETFQPVAYYIAAKYALLIDVEDTEGNHKKVPLKDIVVTPKIILHTSNDTGGDEMWDILNDVGLVAEKKYML